MNGAAFLRYAVRAAVLGALFVTLAGASCTPPTIQENFVLAYVTAQNQINVRFAPINALTNWSDGAFPTTVQAGRGVGLAIDQAGLMHIALTDTSTAVRMIWGLGPAIWDNDSTSTPSAPPDSSPVGIYLGQNRWA